MKKLLLLPMLFLGICSTSQNCNLLKVGMKMNFDYTSYPVFFETLGSKYFTMDKDDRDVLAQAYKKEVAEGKVKPKFVSKLVFEITGLTPDGEYEYSLMVDGKKSQSYYLTCKDSNFYIIRTKGPAPSIVNNDTVGVHTNGVQIVPLNLKVGAYTPGYIDESIMASANKNVVKQNFSVDRRGYNYSGYVPLVSITNVETKVLIMHQGGQVLAEEKINVSGKEYTSYQVSTEVWTKSDVTTNTEVEKTNFFNDPALSKVIIDRNQKSTEKLSKKAAKLLKESGKNEQGYVVSKKMEWIVPGLTIVKTIDSDDIGTITGVLELKSID